MKRCKPPSTKEEVQSFLGSVTYLGQRFIPNMAELTQPIRQLTHKGSQFAWTYEHQRAFDILIEQIAKSTMLGYFSNADKTRLYADASPVGLGACLVQIDKAGKQRPIAFASKTLSNADRALSQTEREALALVWSIEHFNYYLRGRTFDLVTDHKALEVIFGTSATASTATVLKDGD